MQGTQELLSVPWHRADLAPCLSPGTGPLSQWARRGLHSCTHAGQRLEPSTLRGTTVSCVLTVGTGLETGSSSDKALCCGARLNAPFPPGKMLFPPVVHSGPSLACSMSYTHDLPTRFEVAAATISEQLPNPQHMPMVKGTGQRWGWWQVSATPRASSACGHQGTPEGTGRKGSSEGEHSKGGCRKLWNSATVVYTLSYCTFFLLLLYKPVCLPSEAVKTHSPLWCWSFSSWPVSPRTMSSPLRYLPLPCLSWLHVQPRSDRGKQEGKAPQDAQRSQHHWGGKVHNAGSTA